MLSEHGHTANIAIKPVTTVKKTSQKGFAPLSEVVSMAVATVGVSSADRLEIRLSLSFAFFFALDALGVKLIVVESNEQASE